MTQNQRLLSQVKAMPEATVRADYENAASSYPAQIAAARAEGFERANLSSEEDAAALYLDLKKKLKALPEDAVELFQNTKGDHWEKEAGEKYGVVVGVLHEIETAARVPHCTFDIGQAPAQPAIDLPIFRKMAKLTTSAAILMLDKGNPQMFAVYLNTACRMSNQLEGTPSLINALVQTAQVTIIANACERALQSYGEQADVREAVSVAMRLVRPAVFGKMLLAGEYEFGAEMLDVDPMKMFTDPGDDPSVIPDILRDLPHDIVRNAGKARMLACAMETNAALESSSEKPAVDRLALVREVPNRWLKVPGAVDAFAGSNIAMWTETFPATVKGAARIRLTQCLVALCAARAKKDAYPENLPEACPVDPFSLQPFQYSRKGQGFVLYSVGENGKDDGGNEKLDVLTSLPWL